MDELKIYNRYTNSYEEEKIFGGKLLFFLYNNIIGYVILILIVKNSFFSKLYGLYMGSSFSLGTLKKFVKDYKIDLSDYYNSVDGNKRCRGLFRRSKYHGYSSFNEFFVRKKIGIEDIFFKDKKNVVFPADGRHSVILDINSDSVFKVKKKHYDLGELFQDKKRAEQFNGGSALFSRLCPVDYHRFHFVASGEITESTLINGNLFSVNPKAVTIIPNYYDKLKDVVRPWIFWENKRMLSYLTYLVEDKKSHIDEHQIAVMEVGATNVGSIVQTYQKNKVNVGDEKGYFALGGSLVITFFKKNSVRFSDDLIRESKKGFELYAQVGDKCGEFIY